MTICARRTFAVLGSISLVALNVGVFAFYNLWQIADTAAINLMETASGVNPAALLPHSNLMWVAAHGSILAVVALDVLAIAFVAVAFSPRHRRNASGVRAASLSS
ncbi:cell surface protein [Arthrobacter sp. MYb213]|nr:cell surface protein [Arthrobacter sp. MYb213]